MKNKRFFRTSVYAWLILCVLFAFQDKVRAQSDESPTKEYGKKEFIQDFQNAVLLVRLQDKDLTLKRLEEEGLQEQAEKIREMQRRENRETVLSFRKTFDFCPVYFFYAKDSEAIRKGDYKDKLFDADFQAAQVSSNQKVFTAEFAETDGLGIDGLIIRDDQLLSFEDPIPYFERRFVFFGLIERSKARMVEAYNKRLHQYSDKYRQS
ncbi:hypothetical protein [Croceimicrobium sp.]|uniref:hypothetical protein n=1 Tax=Croceimicrobium sp. TaxID=2828340 RepID=UPI003BAD6175